MITPAVAGPDFAHQAARNYRQRTIAELGLAAVFVLVLSACSSTGGGAGAPNTAAPNTAAPNAAAPNTGALPLGDATGWGQVKASDGRSFLTDSRSRALQLRGFNIKTRDPLKDASDEMLAAGQQRGFNLLRLSIYWDQFEPQKDIYDEEYLKQVDTVLDRAAAHGIYVVIDFHQDVFGAKFGDHGVPGWATKDDNLPYQKQDVWLLNYLQPAVQAAWENLYEDAEIRKAQTDAWATVAERYMGKPALLGYDLLNEPFGKLRPGETVAQAATRVQATQMTDMYQRLTDAIHAVDPGHWVLFEPPNVASLGVPVALGKIKDTKLIYYPHFYDAAIESATYVPGSGDAAFNPAFFESYKKAIQAYPVEHGYPMMWGEWGIASPDKPGMDAFVAQSLALMDELGSGWTVFNWCKGEGYCPLDKQGNDRPAIGQIVQPYARATAGVPTTFGFDRKTKTFKVVFTDGDAKGATGTTGTTEIVVPASSYPDGFTVEASDPAGAWTSITDNATATTPAIAKVTVPKGATHAVCIKPKTAAAATGPKNCAA